MSAFNRFSGVLNLRLMTALLKAGGTNPPMVCFIAGNIHGVRTHSLERLGARDNACNGGSVYPNRVDLIRRVLECNPLYAHGSHHNPDRRTC